MSHWYALRTAFAVVAILGISAAHAQQPPLGGMKEINHFTLHDVHAAGKLLTAGRASDDSGKMHLMVGIRLEKPLAHGVTTIAATVTRNEPSQHVQDELGSHAGDARVVYRVDVTCPLVNVIALHGKTNAFGENCRFNGYQAPN